MAETYIPGQVTRRKAMAALILTGKKQAVEDFLASIPGIQGELARNDFNESMFFERDWPLIAAAKQALGWSDAEVDELFKLAATL